MADENAYLQYEDGLVLHNGLPVKWLTYKPEWVDFPIILHFDSNFVSPYSGVTCPARGLSNNSLPGWSNRIKKTATGMSLDLNPQGGGRTSTGHITCLTGYDAYDAWLNTQAANPDYPFEAHDFQYYSAQGLTTFKYPAANTSGMHRDHYFGIDSQNALHPFDLSNHGSSGTSEVTRYYMPAATSIAFAFNASNFTAIRNLYAPNCTRISGWVGDWDEFWTGSSQVCELENITLGNFMDVVNNDSANRNIGLPTNPLSSVKNVVFRGEASGTKTNMAMKDDGIISGFSADIAVTMNGGTVYSAFARTITIPNCSADECGAITINNGRVKNTQGLVGGSNVTFETDSIHSVAVTNPIFTQPNTNVRYGAQVTGVNGSSPYELNDIGTAGSGFVRLSGTTANNVINANTCYMYNSLLRGDIKNADAVAIYSTSEVSGGITGNSVNLGGGSHVHGKIRTPNITIDASFADDLDTSNVMNTVKLVNGSSAGNIKAVNFTITNASADNISATNVSASASNITNIKTSAFRPSGCNVTGITATGCSSFNSNINGCSANTFNTYYAGNAFNVTADVFSAYNKPSGTNFSFSAISAKFNGGTGYNANGIALTANFDTVWSANITLSGISAYHIAYPHAMSAELFPLDNNTIPVLTGQINNAGVSSESYMKLHGTVHAPGYIEGFARRYYSKQIIDLRDADFVNDSGTSSTITLYGSTFIIPSAKTNAANITCRAYSGSIQYV